MKTRFPITAIILFGLTLASVSNALGEATVRGMITDQQSGLPVQGVTVRARDDAAERLYETRTDGFGRYRIEAIEPGAYTLETAHPGYHPETEPELELLADTVRRWDTELTLKAQTIEIFVEAACVMTGIELKNVPVTLTVTPSGEGGVQTLTGQTDELGVIHFPGLPVGFYQCAVNTGADKIPGWESHTRTFNEEFTGHRWIEARLKPEPQWLRVSVFGFNPVTEEDDVPLAGIIVECEGLHPDNPDMVVVPVRSGVSAIRREGDVYWDNTMAEKVRFHGLPPVPWRVQGKRLGYHLSETGVTVNAEARLEPNELRLEMVLMETVLSVEVETPYDDPAMLDGLAVRIQGLKDSNTEGIDRIRTVTYDASNQTAIAVFDRILPGRYLATVSNTVSRTVPIEIGGTDINEGKANPYSRFSVFLYGSDYIEAHADEDQRVSLACAAAPVTLRGRLVMADELLNRNFSFFRNAAVRHYRGTNRRLVFHASEYDLDHLPEAYHETEVWTDDFGEFSVTLLPGMYGVTAPELTEHWGAEAHLRDPDQGINSWRQWPHYQVWPHSLASANAYQRGDAGGITSIGGMALSHGQNLFATLYAYKKVCAFELLLPGLYVWKSPTEHQVTSIDHQATADSQNEPVALYRSIYSDMAKGGTIQLSGPVNQTADLEKRGGARSVIEGLPPGTYTFSIHHPRYRHLTGYSAYPTTFEFTEFPAYPGKFPVQPFPENYSVWNSVFPLGVRSINGLVEASPYGTAEVEIHRWNGEEYYSYHNVVPRFIRPAFSGDRIFYYRQDWRGGTPNSSYTMWLCYKYHDDNNNVVTRWYSFNSSGGDLRASINLDGPNPTPTVAPLTITHSIATEAREWGRGGDLITGVQIILGVTETVTSGTVLSGRTNELPRTVTATHPSWRFNGYVLEESGDGSANPAFNLIVFMARGLSMRGEVRSAVSGRPIPGATIRLWNLGGTFSHDGSPTDEEGRFTWPFELGDAGWFLEVVAPGFEPFRMRLDPAMAVTDPADPRVNAYLIEGDQAVQLTPYQRPVIDAGSLIMNRRGAFLPGVSRAGNQTAFNRFAAEGPLTMTWSLDVGLPHTQYAVTLPGFEQDGQPQPPQVTMMREDLRELWLVDLKNFPSHRYDDEPIAITLPEDPEPWEIDAFLDRLTAQDEGVENVYYQRVIRFAGDESDPGQRRAGGQIKLWQLPPDLFQPAFIAVTKMGAVNVYVLEYDGVWAGRELTGARLPAWFAGMADIMGSVAGSQAMLGDGLKNALPRGRIIAMPSFTADIVLRAGGALDYVYSIDTQIREGMPNDAKGLLGLAPGFLGLSLYGGAEATLKGEDREFYLQMKGGVAAKNLVNNDFKPGFLRALNPEIVFTPPPSGEFYHIASYVFDPNNQPHEVATLYGVSGQSGVRMTASLAPVLKYIPKIGPVLLMLDKANVFSVRALTRGIVGVRALRGFKTTFPRQTEHYVIQGPETQTMRRTFLGGSETGDPVRTWDASTNTTLDIAVGFGVGLDVRFLDSMGARGSIELAGDDAWTQAPAMLLDVNPNGDWPIIRRVRGDVRAVLEAYLETWVATFQKRWHWKAWPIDHQYGTESVMVAIELEMSEQRRDLGEFPSAEFLGGDPIIIDELSPWSRVRAVAGLDADRLIYTDVTAGGGMALRTAAREAVDQWGSPPVTIVETAGVLAGADIVPLPSGEGYLAVWCEIEAANRANYSPPSRLRFALGNAQGTTWSVATDLGALDAVAGHLRLFRHGAAIGLVYSLSADGPGQPGEGLYGLLYAAGEWSAPQPLHAHPVVTLDVDGSDDPATLPTWVVTVSDNDELWAVEWDDGGPQPAVRLSDDAGRALAIAGRDGRRYLVWSMAGGGIGLFKEDPGTGWLATGVGLPDAGQPDDLAVVVSGTPDDELVIVWTQGDGEMTAIYRAVLDADGNPLRTPQPISQNVAGHHFEPTLLPGESDGIVQMTVGYETDQGILQWHGYRVAYEPYYTVIYSAGAGGVIVGDSPQWVTHGDDADAVTAQPAAGAVFDRWSDGIRTATRQDLDLDDDLDVTARFRSLGGVPIDWYATHGFAPGDDETWADLDAREPPGSEAPLRVHFIAATDPRDPNAVFQVLSAVREMPPVIIVEPYSSERIYTLQYTVSIETPDWINVPGQVRVPGGLRALTGLRDAAPVFYRVIVDEPVD